MSYNIKREIDVRLTRIEHAIEKQRVVLRQIHDRDTRSRIGGHLPDLIEMRDRIRGARLETMILR